jgi:hypothetical protein
MSENKHPRVSGLSLSDSITRKWNATFPSTTTPTLSVASKVLDNHADDEGWSELSAELKKLEGK